MAADAAHAHDMKGAPISRTTSRTPLPAVTDAMRAAAYPEGVHGHAAHDHAMRGFALVEKFEWRDGPAGGAPVWDLSGWLGGAVDRLWFRTDGERSDAEISEGDVELFWGHAVSRWWDTVIGLRYDFAPNSSRTWLAFGLQGLAPQWFETQLTGYVTERGQFAAILQVDYDLLLTNRLILQPRLDFEAFAKDDDTRRTGSGLANGRFSMRLRYEIRRQFAPYIGFEWERAFGDTGDYVRSEGNSVEDTRLVVGVRMWF